MHGNLPERTGILTNITYTENQQFEDKTSENLPDKGRVTCIVKTITYTQRTCISTSLPTENQLFKVCASLDFFTPYRKLLTGSGYCELVNQWS